MSVLARAPSTGPTCCRRPRPRGIGRAIVHHHDDLHRRFGLAQDRNIGASLGTAPWIGRSATATICGTHTRPRPRRASSGTRPRQKGSPGAASRTSKMNTSRIDLAGANVPEACRDFVELGGGRPDRQPAWSMVHELKRRERRYHPGYPSSEDRRARPATRVSRRHKQSESWGPPRREPSGS